MLNKAADNVDFDRALKAALLSFKCVQDEDIENFLHNKAEDFINRKLCQVYLILNEDDFRDGFIKIEAYFTLSFKSMISNPNKISLSKIRKISGNKKSKTLDFVLIGQLGKHVEYLNGNYIRSEISGNEILDTVFDVIKEIDALIPCKFALIECNNEAKVKEFYENYNFSFFQHDDNHNQYIKFIE